MTAGKFRFYGEKKNSILDTKNVKPKEIHDHMDKKFGKNTQGIWKNVKIKLYDESDFAEVADDQEEDEADNIQFEELDDDVNKLQEGSV